MARLRCAFTLAAVFALALLPQGLYGTETASIAASIGGATASTATAKTTGSTSASANLPKRKHRRLLGVPVCTLGYLPGCPEPGRSVFGNIVNGSGATVFLRGMPFRQTSSIGSYNLSTVASANGDYSFSNLVRGVYDIVPAQAGFTFEPTSVEVGVLGADATAPSITRKPQ